MSGFVLNQLSKRTGAFIGAQAFNSQTSSCDVFNNQGQACCVNREEAVRNKMLYCDSGSTLPNIPSNNIKRNSQQHIQPSYQEVTQRHITKPIVIPTSATRTISKQTLINKAVPKQTLMKGKK